MGASDGWCCGNFTQSSIVNGSPLPDGTQWNSGTAFWSSGVGAFDSVDTVTVNLAHTATVSQIWLQADNNDTYRVSYWNGSNWQLLSDFGKYGAYGLATRSLVTLDTPVTTNAFQIIATDGDLHYSVGQFTAMGNVAAVPEPETYAMMMAGLGIMGVVARRRKQQA